MFVERKINPGTSRVELWWANWENPSGSAARKALVQKIGEEQSIGTGTDAVAEDKAAICWAFGRTLGNIAITSPALLGFLPGSQGDNAKIPCDLVHAGKYRHGADRWWCRTHQCHWGTRADLTALKQTGRLQCSGHAQPMSYVVSPETVNVDSYAEVSISCWLPAALSTDEIRPRPPKIHVCARGGGDSSKFIDQNFSAISVVYGTEGDLFGNGEPTRVNITPPAAFEYVIAAEAGKEMDCVNCSNCGYPHLDLGEFGKTPHRKHFCGNCGRDSTWSQRPIISTPLKPLHDRYARGRSCEGGTRSLDLDEFHGCTYTVWASTPAIVWKAPRAQEFGFHVHVHRGKEQIVDDTFGEVILRDEPLVRERLIQDVVARTIV